MSFVFQHIISKFQSLNSQEKKIVLCCLTGLIDIETLSVLRLNLEPVNFKIISNKKPNISIKNPSSNQNLSTNGMSDLQDVIENSVDRKLFIEKPKTGNPVNKSFDRFILSKVREEIGNNVKLNPIDHEHVVKLSKGLKSTHKHRAIRNVGVNMPDSHFILIKQIIQNFTTNNDKSKILMEILFIANWEIQYHIYQCVKRRLVEKWSMESIPIPLLRTIFSFLTPEELMIVSLVNKRWLLVSRENMLWRNKCATLGFSIGFVKLVTVIMENIGEPESRINWFEIFKSIKKLLTKFRTDSNSIVDLKKQKTHLNNEIKSVKIRPKINKVLAKRNMDEANSRPHSKGLIKLDNVSNPDPGNDTRQLMKPIIGQLKQFQSTDEVAIDCKSSNLVSISDELNKSESKFILKWINVNSESHKELGDKFQIKSYVPIETCFKLTGHLDSVTSVKFDKSRMFTSSIDGSLRIWDTIIGRSIRKLYGHKGAVYCLDFNENILVSGGWDMTVIVWSLEPDFSMVKMLYGHLGSVTSVKIARNKEKIISASLDGTLRIYKRDSFELVHVVTLMSNDDKPTGIIEMQIEEVRNFIATGHCDKSIKLVDLNSIDCIYNIGYQKDLLRTIYFQSRLLISGGHTGFLQFWDTNISNKIKHIKAQIQIVTEKQVPLSIESIIYHLESLWTGHNDGSIKEWHLASMTCIRTLSGHKGSINAIYCFDNLMASASVDGSIRTWRLTKSQNKKINVGKLQHFQEPVPFKILFKSYQFNLALDWPSGL